MSEAMHRTLDRVARYFESLTRVQAAEQAARKQLAEQSLGANRQAQLAQENARLRQLLALREQLATPAQAAEVLYDAADPYTRRVIIDKGQTQGVRAGSPVVDERGVLGQVTRVYPLASEVTLLVDKDAAIPVLNVRTQARAAAYGDPTSATAGAGMELRFLAGNADIEPGDLLQTSGVDGVYPPGLPVARVVTVDRRVGSAFAKVTLAPIARLDSARHVLVLEPLNLQLPPRPQDPAASAAEAPRRKSGARR